MVEMVGGKQWYIVISFRLPRHTLFLARRMKRFRPSVISELGLYMPRAKPQRHHVYR